MRHTRPIRQHCSLPLGFPSGFRFGARLGSPLALVLFGCLVVATSSVATAQQSGPVVEKADSFEAKFWKYLKGGPSGYDEWGPFSAAKPGVYPGQSPHGAMLKMYANKIARENPKTLPPKSILIKHNYAADGKTLMAITVMYKAPNYDPAHNNWYWVKYMADGTVARTPPEKGSRMIAGRFQSCIDCHAGAEGNDYVFAND